ncbi:U11/U12 small nuclear ribonucleoprotein 48 kDa protein-like [Branchiostoma lanceolatum]|uniref:U11/U12 small nuclear ribonucleoprotein 48 kDa protein-like n=1 Tax=Branchiostoma lanceolatum TaxID=7740 RepID=UPI0034521E1D
MLTSKTMHKLENHETSREDQLEELSCYLDSSRGKLSGILQRLGWTDDKTAYVDMVLCPLDSAHRVPPSRLAEHVKDCRLAKAGYNAEEREKMKESSQFYYTNSQSVVPVMVDRDIQEKVISQCASSSSSWGGISAEQGRRNNSQMSFTETVSSASPEAKVVSVESSLNNLMYILMITVINSCILYLAYPSKT